RWTADAGVAFTLSSGEVQLKEVGGEFFQVSNGLPYNPQSGRHGSFDYQLRGPDGTRYMYSVAEGLREIIGSDGTRLVWTNNGITGPDGSRIAIERDSAGRVIRIVAPDGTQGTYSYDAAGNLVQASFLEDGVRTWLGYRADQNHLLTDIAGPTPEVVEYDELGRFVGVETVGRVLGTLREFVGVPLNIAVPAEGVRRIAFIISPAELATVQSGRVTLGVELIGA